MSTLMTIERRYRLSPPARRVFAICAACALVIGLALVLPAGHPVFVRSYLRLERAWDKYCPVSAAKSFVRSFEPILKSWGALRPVRIEIEPQVSLLLDPEDDVSRTILVSRQGKWEPEVWEAILKLLSNGAVFLDVGAHIGYDTLKAARVVGASGTVIAFEPNPNTLTILRANVDASHASNVVIEPIACSDVESTLTLFDATLSGNSGSSSLSAQNAGVASRAYSVRARPIDAVVAERGLRRVDLLKADVEGAEVLVLKGARETLRRFGPILILEVVPRQLENMKTSVQELEAFLKSLGYDSSRWIDYKNKEYRRSAKAAARMHRDDETSRLH